MAEQKTLKEFIAGLQELVTAHPELADKQVVYSQDDEGNYFQNVHFGPTVGVFSTGGDFNTETDDDDNCLITGNTNAVCIN